jgi:hypothetical protein
MRSCGRLAGEAASWKVGVLASLKGAVVMAKAAET